MITNETFNEFLAIINENQELIYNEASLQFELCHFLRNNNPDFRVLVERHVIKDEGLINSYFTKKVIDVLVKEGNTKCAIELKFPQLRATQVPNQMFNYCLDIKFLEDLFNSHIDLCYSLILTDNHSFWEGSESNGIYKYFRNGDQSINLSGKIEYKKKEIELEGNYKTNWENLGERLHYILLKINL